MKKSNLGLWLTRIAGGLIILDLLLIFVVPAGITFGSLLLVIVYAAWLVFTLIIASLWLTIRYRGFFRTWPGWAIPLVLLVFSSMVVQGVLPVTHPNFSLFFAMLFVVSICSVGIATAILALYRDVGLGLVAWGLVILIWALLLSWRFQGNLIELSVYSLIHPGEPPPLWWFNQLMCILGCVFPLGVISFVGHTLRLILRECQ